MSIQFYRFEEVDLFFWVGLALALDRLPELCWLLFISQTLGMLGMLVIRAREVVEIDRALGR
jgi:4-hydroxybenzoate polyprenyltransferase